MKKTIREQIDDYVKEKYHIDPEILPFSRENYEIFRHKDSGKWFAVFIVKDKKDFGLDGTGKTEIMSFKIADNMLADSVVGQSGYLRGFPSSKWNWTSALLDGTVPLKDLLHWIDKSYEATNSKSGNKKTPLPKREVGYGRKSVKSNCKEQ